MSKAPFASRVIYMADVVTQKGVKGRVKGLVGVGPGAPRDVDLAGPCQF